MNKPDNILLIAIDAIEKIASKLVSAQIDIERMKNTLEKQYQYKIARPVDFKLDYYPDPPRKLHIISPFFPPKIQIHTSKTFRPKRSFFQSETEEIWNAALGKLYLDNVVKCADLRDLQKAIIWFTYFYPNKINFNVNNQTIKAIIYALSDYFLPVARKNRAISIIIDSAIDRKKPRTEIMIIEDLGQLETLKRNNFFTDFDYSNKKEINERGNKENLDTLESFNDPDEEFFQP